MRVLLLTTTFPASPGDGTPSFVADLGMALAQHQHVTALAPRMPHSLASETLGKMDVVRFPYFPKVWEGLATEAIMPTLRKSPWRAVEVPSLIASMHRWASGMVRDGQVDVVNAHWILPSGLVAASLKRRFGVPYVVTVHGADAFTLRGPLTNQLKARVLQNAEAVLPVSLEIAEAIRPLTGDVSLKVVPMGSHAEDPDYLPVPRSRDRFLFVGRLAEKKGVDTALEAMSQIEGGSLFVVGSGPDQARLEAKASELNLGDRVQFAGRLPREEVVEALRQALAVVIPSRVSRSGDREGTPVVLAEAFAHGTPVIASEIAGLAEQVAQQETGILVPPGDAQALADAMNRGLSHPDEMHRLGANAQSRFVGGPLDIRTTAAEYVQVFESVEPGVRTG